MRSPNTPRTFARLRGRWLGAALAPIVFLSGCATNTQTGALAGAGIGGVTGAAVGAAARNPVLGAVIGAAAGTAIGASAGADADRREYVNAVRQDVAARGGPVSLEKIRDMTHSNALDSVIINEIRLTRTVYQLTPDQIVWLKQEGVSDAVIQEMQMTAYGRPRGVVYVAEPPPPVVGVGIGFGRRW